MNFKICILITAIVFSHFCSSAQITVIFAAPNEYHTYGDSLEVQVSVTSTYQLSSVTANVSGHVASLTYNQQSLRFTGKVSLVGLNQGDTLSVEVTATDYLGNMQLATRKFIYDVPPIVTLRSPLDEGIANPIMHLKLTCIDIDSCSIKVFYTLNNYLRFAGKFKDSIDKIIDLSAFANTSGRLTLEITDKRGQTTISRTTLYIISNPFLSAYYHTKTKIIDFNYQQLLIHDDSLSYPAIINLSTKEETLVPIKIQHKFGVLTPFGALFFGTDSSQYPPVAGTDWNAGNVYQFGIRNGSAEAKGNYAIWSGPSGPDLFLRNLLNKTNEAVTYGAQNYTHDVAENGLVVYCTLGNWNWIRSYQNGLTTLISDDSSGNWFHSLPVTDGYNILFLRKNLSTQKYSVRLHNAQSDFELSNLGTIDPALIGYKCNNKFIAYPKLNLSGQAQVWLRDSLGVDTQVSFLGGNGNSVIKLLSPGGDIVYTNANKRFLALRSGHTIEIPNFGQYYFSDSSLFLAMGRSLFKFSLNGSVNVCPNSNSTLTSSLTGINYQWQLDPGSGYTNITNGANYSGTNTATLNLINVPTSWYGYKYRSIVNGSSSSVYTLKFSNTWSGTNSVLWESGSNWLCGSIPDGNTDVIIRSGTVEISSNAICRSIEVLEGANVIIRPGFTLTITR